MKSNSMHSLSGGLDNKEKDNFGIGSLAANFKPTSSPNYAFERSVFSFDSNDVFSH